MDFEYSFHEFKRLMIAKWKSQNLHNVSNLMIIFFVVVDWIRRKLNQRYKFENDLGKSANHEYVFVWSNHEPVFNVGRG